MSAELEARKTAAAAALGDFQREAAAYTLRGGPRPPWATWAQRLAIVAGDVLGQLDQAVTLGQDQAATVMAALDDAAGWRHLRADARCETCMAHPAGLCDDHAADLDAAEKYRALERQLTGQAGGQ